MKELDVFGTKIDFTVGSDETAKRISKAGWMWMEESNFFGGKHYDELYNKVTGEWRKYSDLRKEFGAEDED